MTAPKDKLRELCEKEAKVWCCCADDYTLRGRTDPMCGCERWAEIMEDFAKAERVRFAEMAIRHALKDERVDCPGDQLKSVIAAAIAVAEKGDGE